MMGSAPSFVSSIFGVGNPSAGFLTRQTSDGGKGGGIGGGFGGSKWIQCPRCDETVEFNNFCSKCSFSFKSLRLEK